MRSKKIRINCNQSQHKFIIKRKKKKRNIGIPLIKFNWFQNNTRNFVIKK